MAATKWTVGRLAVPGGNVLWRSFGARAKAPLLLVHGGLRGRSTSSKPYELLSSLGSDRRLISWDQLGCGESDYPADPEQWGISRYAEELDAVRRSLAPGPLHLFAASFGSVIALEWLASSRPGDIKSIVLMCPIADGARAQSSMRDAQAASGAHFPRTYIMRRPPPPGVEGPPDPDLNQKLIAELSSWNQTAALKSLPAPVLFVRGEYDYITDADMNSYAAQCPGSETATIEDAAHLAFIDNPDATCKIVD